MGKTIAGLDQFSSVTESLMFEAERVVEGTHESGRVTAGQMKTLFDPVVMRGTWSELRAAGAAFQIPHGAIVECTDWPGAGVDLNSYWRAVVIFEFGTLFSPLSGEVLLGQSRSGVSEVTTEEVVASYEVKAGLAMGYSSIQAETRLSKSDALNASVLRVYIGENGDNTDALIQEVAIPAEDRSAAIKTVIVFSADDECIVFPADTRGGCDTSVPSPGAVSITNIDATDWKLTFTIQNADDELETDVVHNFAKVMVL